MTLKYFEVGIVGVDVPDEPRWTGEVFGTINEEAALLIAEKNYREAGSTNVVVRKVPRPGSAADIVAKRMAQPLKEVAVFFPRQQRRRKLFEGWFKLITLKYRAALRSERRDQAHEFARNEEPVPEQINLEKVEAKTNG